MKRLVARKQVEKIYALGEQVTVDRDKVFDEFIHIPAYIMVDGRYVQNTEEVAECVDIEFKDTNGKYRHYKSGYDHGTVFFTDGTSQTF